MAENEPWCRRKGWLEAKQLTPGTSPGWRARAGAVSVHVAVGGGGGNIARTSEALRVRSAFGVSNVASGHGNGETRNQSEHRLHKNERERRDIVIIDPSRGPPPCYESYHRVPTGWYRSISATLWVVQYLQSTYRTTRAVSGRDLASTMPSLARAVALAPDFLYLT